MPETTPSAYFREQRPRCHTLEGQIAAEVQAITNGTGESLGVKPAEQSKVQQLAQAKDITAPKAKVFARALAKTGWFLYICAGAGTAANKQVLMLVGKPVNPGAVFPFFDWVLSAEDLTVLNGDVELGELTNAVDMDYAGALKYAHGDKHFDAKKKGEAQFTIGADNKRKNIVAGMEQKAIDHGFGTGERFFKFSVVVGTDPVNTTRAIRVDTPGGPSQHSHPIPETGNGEVNHDRKVLSMIALHTRERQQDELVALARYLKLIGTGDKAFNNLKNKFNDTMWGGLRPPPCKYWSW